MSFVELSQIPYQHGLQITPKTPINLSDAARASLVKYYNSEKPRVHLALDRHPPPQSQRLVPFAQFYEYALLHGCRISPTSRTARGSAGSSIIKANLGDGKYAGEVSAIFRHHQLGINDETLFAEVSWMKLLDLTPVDDDPWSDL